MKQIDRLLLLLFIAINIFPEGGEAHSPPNNPLQVQIGLILDLNSLVGKLSSTCISMALSDFYAAHNNYTTRLLLHSRDSQQDTVTAASHAVDLLKNVEVLAILGPQTSAEAEFVVDLGDRTQVPIVSFSATCPSLSPTLTPYFVRTAQNDSSQVKAIASIVQAFGWREVVPIYVDTHYGSGIIPFLSDALEEVDARITFRSVLSPAATDDQIREELYKLMTMQTRIFVVHMFSSLASRLFLQAKEVGMMSNEYAWIITDGITDLLDSLDSSVIDSMQGVLGVKPFVPNSKARENFTVRWKQKFRRENPEIEKAELSTFGLWAYDTVWALCMAVEQAVGSGIGTLNFRRPSFPDNSTDLVALGVSPMGPTLLKAILNTRFKGLSGDFRLVEGQLQSSGYQIVNVIGKGEREIGFWTSATGISRKMNPKNMSKTYSASLGDLGPVIWPGESTVVPRGWAIPTTGKKLRIGVPVKNGFSEFMKVERDPHSNGTTVIGFPRDVFDSVMGTLPYAVPYEFIPFENSTGQHAGTYDDLIYQVYLQKYDAVVGDITIIANRSLYVDFTLPYSESGVSMIVAVRADKSSKNAWVFLKPLTRELWVTSGAFFVLTGMVVWMLEHRINPDFRGPPAEQLGVIFFFSFSTMVFAHRERIASNLSRFVVIIWVFVVLILTSSYTASLTSMLTVQQLTPTVTDIDSLLKNGDFVGYQEGSFVAGLLNRLKFDESKLRAYESPEEYAEALSKGSQNGGVSAIFDEIPYIKLFLAKYCNNYTMLGPTYKTGGFGFVFPKGSPLVPDVSRAVLNVTEGHKMMQIERAWFGPQATCPDPGTSVSSSSLTLQSFWGLFLITGTASLTALFIFAICFVHDHRDILRTFNSSLWQRLVAMARSFDERDLSFHTFRNTSGHGGLSVMPVRGNEGASPGSPSSFSVHPESVEPEGSFTIEEEGTPSAEFEAPSPNASPRGQQS